MKWALTVNSDLLDLLQNLSLHIRVSADLLPCSHDASLFGQFCQLFLVGNHEADHVVLFTARTNIRNKHQVKRSSMGSSESAQRRCRSRANTEGVEMSVIAQVKVEVEVKRESCEVKVSGGCWKCVCYIMVQL